MLGSKDRQDGVVNVLTIKYAAGADGTFTAQAQVEDTDSTYTTFCPAAAYAENLVAFWLRERA